MLHYIYFKKNVSIDKDCKITVDVTSKKKNGLQAEPSRILAVGSNQTISIEKSLLVKTPKLKKKSCKKTMLIKKLYLCDICKQNCEEISLAFQDNSIKCDSCLQWYHFDCVNISNDSEIPEQNEKWYCSDCKISNQEQYSN